MKKIPKVLLLIDTASSSTRLFLAGIARYSRIHGPWMFHRNILSEMDLRKSKKILSRLKDWHPDGIIAKDTEDFEEILAMDVPVIFLRSVTRQRSDLAYIYGDSAAVGKVATNHFLDHGFRNFAFCGFAGKYLCQERCEGFCDAVSKAGFETFIYQHPKSKSNRLWENEQAFIVDWLKQLPKPVGILASEDLRGQNIIDACNAAGLLVPEEMAVMGIDNDKVICGLTSPPLSSIAFNSEISGFEAAELLDQMMAGKKGPKQHIIEQPSHVVTRQSTDVLAIKDSSVVEAIRFIRQNADKLIQVSDVITAAATARRTLEQRFRKILNRSIHNEIKRVRIDKAAQMLVETNMSISQISFTLGYNSVTNMSRYFYDGKRITPLAYRKKFGPIKD